MFTSISWNEYLSFTFTALFLYYTFIALRFYKWELLAIAGIKRELPATKQLYAADLKRQFIGEDHATSATLKSEITALIANSPETISSNTLSDSLNAVIRKYPSLAIQEQQDLSRFIYEEAGAHFPGLLTSTDVEQLWFG